MAVCFCAISSKWRLVFVWLVQNGSLLLYSVQECGLLLCGLFKMAVCYFVVCSRWRCVILRLFLYGGLLLCCLFKMPVCYCADSLRWRSVTVRSVHDGGVLLCRHFYMASCYCAVSSRWRSVTVRSVRDGGRSVNYLMYFFFICFVEQMCLLLQIQSICRRKNKWDSKVEIWFEKNRKHFGERRKCCLPAFSPFPTLFSKGIFLRVVKSRDSVERVKQNWFLILKSKRVISVPSLCGTQDLR